MERATRLKFALSSLLQEQPTNLLNRKVQYRVLKLIAFFNCRYLNQWWATRNQRLFTFQPRCMAFGTTRCIVYIMWKPYGCLHNMMSCPGGSGQDHTDFPPCQPVCHDSQQRKNPCYRHVSTGQHHLCPFWSVNRLYAMNWSKVDVFVEVISILPSKLLHHIWLFAFEASTQTASRKSGMKRSRWDVGPSMSNISADIYKGDLG